MTNRGNDIAYPVVIPPESRHLDTGMTIREKIAAQTMASLSASFFGMTFKQQMKQEEDWIEKYGGETTLKSCIVKDSIELTDCLIAELSKQPEK